MSLLPAHVAFVILKGTVLLRLLTCRQTRQNGSLQDDKSTVRDRTVPYRMTKATWAGKSDVGGQAVIKYLSE